MNSTAGDSRHDRVVTRRPEAPTAEAPIEGVLFDFHSTLVDGGDPGRWLAQAWLRVGRVGRPEEALGAAAAVELRDWLDRIWEHARDLDPGSERDLSPERHREVYDRTIARNRHIDAELAHALYLTMTDQWVAYTDARPALRALQDRGVRSAVLSNVGLDIRPILDREGLAEHVDTVVLSYEHGVVKPDAAIFARALELLGVPAARALMVGDSWLDDGGAAALGVRTLILPRTDGPAHGLDAVLRLVGTERRAPSRWPER